MGDLSDFQRGQIVGARSAGASVTKMATLLGVSRAAVYKVMTKYIHHGKTSSAKGYSVQKPKLNERGHRTLKRTASINLRSTAAKVTAGLNVHLEDHFHKKKSDDSFTNPTSMVELQLLNGENSAKR
jgi:predicted transcriptional regulator